jgi:hypothetical protein
MPEYQSFSDEIGTVFYKMAIKNGRAEFFTDIPRFWHGRKLPRSMLPQTPFKTEVVVESLWRSLGVALPLNLK